MRGEAIAAKRHTTSDLVPGTYYVRVTGTSTRYDMIPSSSLLLLLLLPAVLARRRSNVRTRFPPHMYSIDHLLSVQSS